METIRDVPILLRREIEALMVAPFLKAFAQEIGWERTMEISRGVISQLAEAAGKDAAAQAGGTTFRDFQEKVHPSFAAGGALESDLRIDEEEGCMRMDVTRCAYADMYQRIGLKELGALLSCQRDGSLFKGFNPDWEFIRTQTIMGGGSICDFCLRDRTGK